MQEESPAQRFSRRVEPLNSGVVCVKFDLNSTQSLLVGGTTASASAGVYPLQHTDDACLGLRETKR